MFTPQKVWSGFPHTPKGGALKTGNASGANLNHGVSNHNFGDGLKGTSVTFGEPTTPLFSGSMADNGETLVVGSGETALDRERLLEKISNIEKELFEYQYNMGLLLIEKKEWTCKYEEYSQALIEAKHALKREQSAHLIVISDVDKREQTLMKALGVEKECVIDLEKAYREIFNENAEINVTFDSKLAEANALAASIEEKSLEVEAKLRASDAKLAEVNRRSAEADRKLQDLEILENATRMDRLSFNAEKESQDSILSKQREDLREWERKLQDGEERLADGQKNINQREERANENDRIFKLKEKGLEEVQKKIDASNIELVMKENDISCRLANVIMKEKESESMKINLEVKEKELLALEQKLKAREEAEIQKLLDDHNAVLASKKLEFELEFDQKKKSLEEELKTRMFEVEMKEVEIKHTEEKVGKREQALEKRLEKLREKEENYDLKLKALSETERSIKTEEKKLVAGRKQLLVDIENSVSLKAEIEKIRTDNEEQILKLREGRDHLKVSESERFECLRLQSELKQEIDDCRTRQEMLMKESEDLKEQKETFEREWEEQDEKRAQIEIELRDLMQQKEEVQKLRRYEEERLKNERLVAQEYIQREQESLKLAKESFEATMDLERSEIAEKLQRNRSQMLHEFELQKRELETDMQNQSEEMDKQFREKQQLFNEEKERELENVNYLRDVARREMEEMKLERFKIGKERQEAEANKVHLEKQRVEIRNDIHELFKLSGELKDQLEQLIKERERLISFVEKQKSCKNCLEMASEFVLSDLQPLAEEENVDSLTLRRHADDHMGAQELQLSPSGNQAVSDLQNNEVSPVAIGLRSHASGGTVSWLRKCTSKILKFSPVKKTESPHQLVTDDVQINWPEQNVCTMENETGLSFAIVSDIERVQSDYRSREFEASEPSADNQSNINSEVPEEPQPSELRGGQGELRKKGKLVSRSHSLKAVIEDAKSILGNGEGSSQVNAERRDEFNLAIDEFNQSNINSEVPEEPQPSELRGGQRKLRKKGKLVSRSHSVKAVIEDAKSILGNGEGSSQANAERRDEFNLAIDEFNQSNINREVPEEPQPSELRGDQRKLRKKGKLVGRSHSVKAVIEDAKSILGNGEGSSQVNAERRDEFNLAIDEFNQSNINSEVPEEPQPSELRGGQRKLRKKGKLVSRSPSVKAVIEDAKSILGKGEGSSQVNAERRDEFNLAIDKFNQSNINREVPEEPQPSVLRGDQRKLRKRRKLVSRSHSVKAVIEDAKSILGKGEGSSQVNAERRDEFNLAIDEFNQSNINSEVPEEPQPSELRGDQRKLRKKEKLVSRSHSVKAVIEDAKSILGNGEGSSQVNAEKRDEFNLAIDEFNQSNINSEMPEEPQPSELRGGQRKLRKKGKLVSRSHSAKAVIEDVKSILGNGEGSSQVNAERRDEFNLAIDEFNQSNIISEMPEEPQPSELRGGQRKLRKKGKLVSRLHSAKAVIEDAKSILGNGEGSSQVNAEGRDEFNLAIDEFNQSNIHSEVPEEPQPSELRGGQRKLRKKGKLVSRSPSVKAVSEDAKSILGNGEGSSQVNAERRDEFNLAIDEFNQSNINSEVPEEPQPSELRGGQRKLRKKGKLVSRSHSVKAVIEDAKSILGNGEGSSPMNAESRDEFNLADKKLNNARKRSRSNLSNIVSENHGGESEGHSGNVVSQPRKRRQRVASEVQTPGEARYNLRRQKTAATEDSTQYGKGNVEEVDGIRNTEEEIHYSKVLPAPSLGAASDNGGSTHFVQCGTAVDFQDKNLSRLKK